MAYLVKISEIPAQPFYAILEETSSTIPGDERSRTNPGHGYPEHTVSSWNLIAFATEAEWKQDIERRSINQYGYPFKAVKIAPAAVSVQTIVSIS